MAQDAEGALEEAAALMATEQATAQRERKQQSASTTAKWKSCRDRCHKLGDRVARCRVRVKEATALREEQCRDLTEAIALLFRATAQQVGFLSFPCD
jgi:hypothetical protein